MLVGSVFPDVCVPTWFGIACAIVAVAALALLVRSWRQRRRERREGLKPDEKGGWLGWVRRLTPGDWINLALLVLSVGGIVVAAVRCSDDPPDVGISLADSRLNPAEYDEPGDEYVCVVSHEDDPVSLAGWELRGAERRINVLPDFTLEPGASVRVHPGEGRNSRRDLYGEKGSPEWRNEGGQISLLDSEGQEVDAVGYGERKDGDGSGECGSGGATKPTERSGGATKPTELALKITSPDQEATVNATTITITGTVTPGSLVQAKLDHDDESDAGGEVARVVSGDGVAHFTVDVRLEPGENHIRVWAEKPGAEPVFTGVAVIREETDEPPLPLCDPSYEGACLDPEAYDYDCAGGEGDGPEYVEGPIAIVGEDHFDLDGNGDGIACEP